MSEMLDQCQDSFRRAQASGNKQSISEAKKRLEESLKLRRTHLASVYDRKENPHN